MKFLRYGRCGEEKPGVLHSDGTRRDLSAHMRDFCPSLLRDPSWMSHIMQLDVSALPIIDSSIRIGACIDRPGKVICVGFNSKLHAQEMGMCPIPETDMVVFLKPSSSVCGPNDPIFYGPHMKKLDWEAELAVVIGKQGKYLSREAALECILGYTCMNDLSERYLQLETCDKQFTKGKGFDNAAPLGPYLVTKEEVSDANQLQIQLWVNGELRQEFNTADYIHDDAAVVSYVSQYFTLYPGDIISMGSAPGSAASWGNRFLKPNDRVTLRISELGEQHQLVVLESS